VTAVWRIEKEKYAREAFSGDGAFFFGGRWNQAGTRIIYASQTLALAALEKFVHLQGDGAAIRFVCFKIEIPGQVRIRTLESASLPADWRNSPATDATRNLGTGWAQKMESALLRVPSVIIPVEYDYLINPRHPDYRRLRIGKPMDFSFDPRRWTR